MARAPFGDRPPRAHEAAPVRGYSGADHGLPQHELLMSEPFLVETAADDPVWKGHWRSNLRHKRSGQYVCAYHRTICTHRRRKVGGRKQAKTPQAHCGCPEYFFVKLDTHSRKNVPVPYARIVCWAASKGADKFSERDWLEPKRIEVDHDPAAERVVDGVTLKLDAFASHLTPLTPAQHREREAARVGAVAAPVPAVPAPAPKRARKRQAPGDPAAAPKDPAVIAEGLRAGPMRQDRVKALGRALRGAE